jgi:predicted NAD-dependent protein-ADP-ribosyltransferase YbiA (DUF1768 family)
METPTPITIFIPKNPRDKFYGYLSNDSKHGFVESFDNDYTYWKTVTHYVEAKKFEGTQYENKIRNARTAILAKRLAKEREVFVTQTNNGCIPVKKNKIYGAGTNNKICKIEARGDWDMLYEDTLRYALNAKFNQNPYIAKLLVSTSPDILVCSDDDMSGKILMEIRGRLIKNAKFL